MLLIKRFAKSQLVRGSLFIFIASNIANFGNFLYNIENLENFLDDDNLYNRSRCRTKNFIEKNGLEFFAEIFLNKVLYNPLTISKNYVIEVYDIQEFIKGFIAKFDIKMQEDIINQLERQGKLLSKIKIHLMNIFDISINIIISYLEDYWFKYLKNIILNNLYEDPEELSLNKDSKKGMNNLHNMTVENITKHKAVFHKNFESTLIPLVHCAYKLISSLEQFNYFKAKFSNLDFDRISKDLILKFSENFSFKILKNFYHLIENHDFRTLGGIMYSLVNYAPVKSKKNRKFRFIKTFNS